MTIEEFMALIQSEKQQGNDTAALEEGLRKIMSMPPEEQDAALADLSRSYDERRSDLRSELTRNYDTLAGVGPQALEGPSGNPYAYTVAANPLEHITSGINKYMAGRDSRAQKDQLESLNQGEEGQRALLMKAQIDALRRKEEEERRRRMSEFQMPGRTGY